MEKTKQETQNDAESKFDDEKNNDKVQNEIRDQEEADEQIKSATKVQWSINRGQKKSAHRDTRAQVI